MLNPLLEVLACAWFWLETLLKMHYVLFVDKNYIKLIISWWVRVNVEEYFLNTAADVEWIYCFVAQNLEKIIQRDFFPDVTKLQAQKEYLEAEENGDLERMRAIAIRYGSSLAKSTPQSSAPCQWKQHLILYVYLLKRIMCCNLYIFAFCLCVEDVTPASFETPVGHPVSPTSCQGRNKGTEPIFFYFSIIIFYWE